AWKDQPPMPNPRMHSASFFRNNRFYVIGGFTNDGTTSTVYNDVIAADVAADGTIGSWTTVSTLPKPWTHPGSAVVGDYLYLSGGLHGDPFNDIGNTNEVIRGHIEADGSIDEWTNQPHLPSTLATHACFYYGGYVYIVGGIDNVGVTN